MMVYGAVPVYSGHLSKKELKKLHKKAHKGYKHKKHGHKHKKWGKKVRVCVSEALCFVGCVCVLVRGLLPVPCAGGHGGCVYCVQW